MKNYLNKSILSKTLIIVASLILPLAVQAQTLVNLGTLDVKPTAGGQYFNLDLNPGQQAQQQLQISNFSPKPMHLQIYVADAAQSDSKNFIANDQNQLSQDIYPWVTLPTNHLDLASGESKILSVNISSPANAGVGMHTGAIMVKEQVANEQNSVSLEKGVRIYANIKGIAGPNLSVGSATVSESARSLNYANIITNAGNTDLKGNFTFNLYDQNNQVVGSQTQSVYLKPQTSQSLYLATEKPAFGIYHASLSNDLLDNKIQNTDLGTKFFMPNFIAPLAALLALAALIGLAFKQKLRLPAIKLPKLDFPAISRQLALQKAAAFFALVLVIGVFAFGSTQLPNNLIKADLLGSSKSYLTTIKWGNLDNKKLPDTLRTDWQGSIKFDNALISIQDYLNQEKTDKFFINADQNILYYKNVTGPDNDGVNLIVTPTSNEPVKVTYKNNLSTEEISFPLDKTISKTKTFNFKAHQINFSSIASNTIAKKETIVDNSSTEEIRNLESSGEVITIPLRDPELATQIKVLQEVISDLPATSETLSQYILNSNYVQEVSSENNTTTVTADPSLIAALQEAPDTISDITSTEELNFLFIPNEKIRFSPQIFSFNEKKIVTQDLGRIILVQNKNQTWNTYISITDLASVSGKGSINASNISVDPGQIKILSGSNSSGAISSGRSKKLSDSHDTALLVNVAPNNSDQVVFSINPKLTINLPAKTLPGTYRGQISIKVL